MSTLYHPFGARGAYPASIEVGPDHEQFRELQSIPGIRAARQYLYGTWDAIETVHRRLGLVAPQAPAPLTTSLASSELTAEVAQFPGLPEYNRLGLRNKMRLYQREGAAFLARRAYAMECDPPRLGKTFQALAASVLINSSKTLIICPALVSFVWAEEIWKWLGQEAIVLEGRRGIAARQFCGTCGGVGYTQ